MRSFTFGGLPARVVFGPGTSADVASEAKRLGIKRALVLSTPQQAGMADAVASALGDLAAGCFSGAAMHTPVEVTEAAMAELDRLQADGLVAVGGGSTTGLSKAIAYRTGLPQIAIATTYAGSEMTPILGQTEDGVKTTLRDAKVRPRTVIYDVELTLGLPAGLSAVSGMNAIAHAVEALYAPDRNPVIELMAEEGMRALGSALPAIVEAPGDIAARSDALYGAWLCGICLGSTAMALHHKLCHTLGGSFDLPHAETHAVILPYVLNFNASGAPEAAARMARALGVEDAAKGLLDLNRRIRTPRSLEVLGMPQDGIERASELATANPYDNPRDFGTGDIRAILTAAWQGAAL